MMPFARPDTVLLTTRRAVTEPSSLASAAATHGGAHSGTARIGFFSGDRLA